MSFRVSSFKYQVSGARAAAERLVVAAVFCLSAIAANVGAETTAVLAMSSAPQCTQCHLVWLEDFATAGADVLVPYRREADFAAGDKGAESSELMCYSCHDGYVADSRAQIRKGFQHPMAGISELGRTRPRQLPLLREEQVYCGTCHTPHGPGHGGEQIDLEQNAFLRMAERPGPVGLCVLCHEYTGGDQEVGNHAVAKEDYTLPPLLEQLHARADTEKGGIGCQTCHTPHGALNPLLVILGGSEGASPRLCTVCHKDDDSKEGLGAYSHPVDIGLKTDARKPQYPNGQSILLSEGGTMNCLSCHDVHDSAVRAGLLRYGDKGSGLCLACHGEMAEAISGTGHDLRVSAPEARNMAGKTVGESGVCGACHMAHKSRQPYLWSRPMRGGGHPLDRLCLSCHGIGGTASTRIDSTLTHPTAIDKGLIRIRVGETGPSLSVPVFDEELRPGEVGVITCQTCHDAHRWQPAMDDNDKVAGGGVGKEAVQMSTGGTGKMPVLPEEIHTPLGQGDATNSFLRLRSEDQICKHCHGVWGLWRYRYYHSPLRGKR